MPDDQGDTASIFQASQLRTADVNTALVHLYRAEVTRANSWRSRLDVTTNWALLSTGAAISIAFSQQNTHHSVIILNTLLITLFLSIETRRYRYYELWSYRVRLMETDFYAALLVPPFRPDPDLANKLSESLLSPQFPISTREALGRRLRRNYLWVYLILLITWFAKLLLYPESVTSWDQLVARARMGIAPGWLVMSTVITFYLVLLTVAFVTRHLRQSVGEVFPRYGESSITSAASAAVDPQMHANTEPAKAYPLLAIVTAESLEPIRAAIQSHFNRKATLLDPNNTTSTQATLLLSVNITEIAALKALAKEFDENSIVIVIPAYKVLVESPSIQAGAR